MLTKTQEKIMQLFVANIAKSFTIRQVERELKIHYALVHRAITPLIKEGHYLKLNENNLVQLNYKENHDILSYVESNRKNELFKKSYAKDIRRFLDEILDKFEQEYFIIILFGSSVEKSTPGDYDLLFIFESSEIADKTEKAIEVIASNNSNKFHIQALGIESIYEMAAKREQKNLLNELLNKHIILYGSEYFYRLLKHARQ
jgi:hypothetical protein